MRRRSGLIIMIGGLLLAVVAVLVVSISRANNVAPEVRQVLVVVAARDIPELVPVSADALMVKPFPDGFVPAGAISAPEQAVGKFTTTRLVKDPIVVVSTSSPTRRAGNVAASVPKGKVAVAFPGNDILADIGAIRAGDRVDILLSLDLPRRPVAVPARPVPRRAARVGPDDLDLQRPDDDAECRGVGRRAGGVRAVEYRQRPGGGGHRATSSPSSSTSGCSGAQFIKDSGGVIDLALRSPDDSPAVQTDAVTLSTIYDQFRFHLLGRCGHESPSVGGRVSPSSRAPSRLLDGVQRGGGGESHSTVSSLDAPITVLIVDDTRAHRDQISRILGREVESRVQIGPADLAEATRLVRREPPGYRAAVGPAWHPVDTVRRSTPPRRPPRLSCCCDRSGRFRPHCLFAGARAYITHIYNRGDLVEAIFHVHEVERRRRHCSSGRRRPGAPAGPGAVPPRFQGWGRRDDPRGRIWRWPCGW